MSSTEAADTATAGKTPAQLMQEQHDAAAADHHVTVEDVVDEDDVEHPPPSAPVKTEDPAPPASTNGVMSAKAAGKQKASEMVGAIDTQDEEAFPALGSGSKAPTAPRAGGWSAAAAKAPSAKPASRPNSRPGAPVNNSGTRGPSAAAPRPSLLPGWDQDNFVIDNRDIDKAKPRRKVFDDVRKKYNVTVKDMVVGDKTTFYAEGPKNNVTHALMHVSKELSVEKTAKFEIPASATAQVIGAKGANIKKLQEKFSVNINVKNDQNGDAEGGMATVEIKGHAAQVSQAVKAIEQIGNANTKETTLRVPNIPPEFFPFIASRSAASIKNFEQENDVRINIPSYHTWRSQAPAKVRRDDGPERFHPHGDSHITITGNSTHASTARTNLERVAEQLQAELMLEEMQAQQFLHPYIIGDRGVDPIDFLQKTGCMVITPPGNHDTEDIHIIGPLNRLEEGRNYAEELLTRRQHQQINLQKHFSDSASGPERHSYALSKYLQRKAIEREFKNTHGAEIIFPNNFSADAQWTVMSDDQRKVMAARNELSKITQAFPTPRLQLVEIDPFFHPHIEQMHAQKLQEDFGVHLIVPDGDDSVILVYEGPSSETPFQIPRSKPSQQEITEFERALKEAEELLRGSIPHNGISNRDVDVPAKFHDKVRRYVKEEEQSPAGFPVQVDFGRKRAGAPKDSQNKVYLRHPEDSALEELQRKIEQFLVQAEQDEKERGHTITVPFQSKFKKNLVGKNGRFVQALREKFDVDVKPGDDSSDEITIVGPPKKAEACRAEILKLHKAWADEVSYVIKVDPKFHGQLVGKNGENLKRIVARANDLVRVDFPRQSRSNNDDASEVASEAGGRGRQGASDEISIRGPKDKANEVRDELLQLKQFFEDKSHTATVSVAREQVASLIGKGGSELNKLRSDTNTEIDIPRPDGSERVTITVRGSKEDVARAKTEISKRSKAFDAVVTKTIEVEQKHHRALIGSAGANISSLVSKAGGTGSSAEHVKFPKATSNEKSNTLTIKGTQEVVDAIIKEIQAQVSVKENEVVESVDVPTQLHRNLIGPGGANRVAFEKKFGLLMNVPKQNSNETGVKLTGPAENVAKAREHLTSLVNAQKAETISVPRKYHHAVAQNGATFQELRQLGLRVDHGGAKVPPRPTAKPVSSEAVTNGALPLITDQGTGAAEAQPIWELVSLNNDEPGEITWVLSANRQDTPPSAENIAKAKARIEALLKAAATPRFTGYLTLPDPKLHRRVIGQQGQKIESMRQATNCDIQVPKRDQRGSDAITITGSEEGVLKAKGLILEAVSVDDRG